MLSNRGIEDRTQTGHILGNAEHRRGQGVCDRSMTPAVFVLIRLLTHLTMLLGATKDPQVSPSGSMKCSEICVMLVLFIALPSDKGSLSRHKTQTRSPPCLAVVLVSLSSRMHAYLPLFSWWSRDFLVRLQFLCLIWVVLAVLILSFLSLFSHWETWSSHRCATRWPSCSSTSRRIWHSWWEFWERVWMRLSTSFIWS